RDDVDAVSTHVWRIGGHRAPGNAKGLPYRSRGGCTRRGRPGVARRETRLRSGDRLDLAHHGEPAVGAARPEGHPRGAVRREGRTELDPPERDPEVPEADADHRRRPVALRDADAVLDPGHLDARPGEHAATAAAAQRDAG